jgi:hypothetical protein
MKKDLNTTIEDKFSSFLETKVWFILSNWKTSKKDIDNFMNNIELHKDFIKEIETNLINFNVAQIELYLGRIIEGFDNFKDDFYKCEFNCGDLTILNNSILREDISKDNFIQNWRFNILFELKIDCLYFLESNLEKTLSRLTKKPSNLQYLIYSKKILFKLEDLLINKFYWTYDKSYNLEESTNYLIQEIESTILTVKNKKDYLSSFLYKINSLLIKCKNAPVEFTFSPEEYKLYFFYKKNIFPTTALHKGMASAILSSYKEVKQSDYLNYFQGNELDPEISLQLDKEMKNKIQKNYNSKIASLNKVKNVIENIQNTDSSSIDKQIIIKNENLSEPSTTNQKKEKYYSPIFNGRNEENIFLELLEEFNAIDNNNNFRNRKFQPICNALFNINIDDKELIFKSNAELKDYIKFLKLKFPDSIKSDTRLSDGDCHLEMIERNQIYLKLLKGLKTDKRITE